MRIRSEAARPTGNHGPAAARSYQKWYGPPLWKGAARQAVGDRFCTRARFGGSGAFLFAKNRIDSDPWHLLTRWGHGRQGTGGNACSSQCGKEKKRPGVTRAFVVSSFPRGKSSFLWSHEVVKQSAFYNWGNRNRFRKGGYDELHHRYIQKLRERCLS